MKGRLITFEGPEGGGKSTHVKLLADRLRSELGLTVRTTREPGGTPTGEAIRAILQHDVTGEPLCDPSEVFLFCASRAQLCNAVLSPALERGEWVLCDRFTDSTLAYQGYGRGFDLDLLRRLNAFATGAVVPALTLLLDVPAELGMARVGIRSNGGKDRIERESLAFHQRLRDGYLALAAEPDRFAVIDATQSVDAVATAVWSAVRTRLPLLPR
jgi:dTMP kinase